jgi:hypothetical protein
VASAAIGSLLSLLIKEGIDWLRAERSHRLDLRRRYFDAKLDATTRVIRLIKTASGNLRHIMTIIKETAETNVILNTTITDQIARSHSESLKRVTEEATGMLAVMGFYYDDELQLLTQTANTGPTPLVQKMSEFIQHVALHAEARQVLDRQPPPPDDIIEIAHHRLAEYDAKVGQDIIDLARIADDLDETANTIVRRMRKDFDPIRF